MTQRKSQDDDDLFRQGGGILWPAAHDRVFCSPRPGYFAARFEKLHLQLLCCVEYVSPEVSSFQLEVDIHFTTITDLKYPFTKLFIKKRQPNFELE